MRRVVVFTGGGSGGHVFPGVAVVEKLRERERAVEIVWIGSKSPIERDVVARFGIPFIAIPSGKLRRYLSVRNLVDIFKILAGLVRSFFLLRRLQPLLVFSKGGYVSVPPVVAAGLLRIPVFTHESDVDPGLATRINARLAERIFVAYEESRSYFPPAKREAVVVSGNPVRQEIFSGDAEEGRRRVGAPQGRPILLVVGGSQGAQQVNELVAGAIDELLEDFYVVHQMGDSGYRPSDRSGLFNSRFFSGEYADILAASDLVVSRSGAGTLWEIAGLGKASILVPLASYSRGDQLRNAQRFAADGAAIVLSGEEATSAALAMHARRLARDRERLAAMGAAAARIFRAEAAACIAGEIAKRIGAGNAVGTP